MFKKAQAWMDSVEKQPSQKKMDMRSDTWNVRSMYRAGSLKAVTVEVSKYKLGLVGVQVRWDRGGTERAGEYTFFYGKGNENHELGTGFFVHKRIVSSVMRAEFITDSISYIILKGRWCDIIIMNVHTPTEDKIDDLHKIGNDNGVRVVNFAILKNLTVKSTMFPHRNVHTFTWTSPDGKTQNQIDHIFIDRSWHSSILDVRSFRAADCDTDHYLVVGKVRETLTVSK
ncbi:hypothetical protein B7P43_G15414 [Cryptotermes secundus]|uniref:Endonuclease/exonuclease/phosphatase domain-containing protein n=1 Tax=Cryptotermes secundus TaxID=105785 RepID=A0A2J7Q1H3_9NEOP|nr:hypothetical protein B7P43_G15414 [Cryptotermes secundus]